MSEPLRLRLPTKGKDPVAGYDERLRQMDRQMRNATGDRRRQIMVAREEVRRLRREAMKERRR